MASRKSPRPKAPGKNIEDWQRNTERLTLRLRPDVMAKLRELSDCTAEGPGPVAYSKVVEAALDALERELDARDAARNEE